MIRDFARPEDSDKQLTGKNKKASKTRGKVQKDDRPLSSGARGRKFESYRAYHPSEINQSLESPPSGETATSNACLERNSGDSDKELTGNVDSTQTVEVRAVTIKLSRGYVAMIDLADEAAVTAHKWSAFIAQNGTVYAARIEGGKYIYLHRWLMNAPKGIRVDHASGDTMDHTRKNLRFATRTQNNQNRRPNSGRQFKGIRLQASGKWSARIGAFKKYKHLGTFDTAELAAEAYNAACKELHGEFARLNPIPNNPSVQQDLEVHV